MHLLCRREHATDDRARVIEKTGLVWKIACRISIDQLVDYQHEYDAGTDCDGSSAAV
jgi:hypothetical protein